MLARSGLASLALLLLSPLAAAQSTGGVCPDVRASAVAARVEEGGTIVRCGAGIKIFGFEFSLKGPPCPAKRFLYPAHSVCNGEQNEGTMCVPDGKVAVQVESCECDGFAILGTGLAFPKCTCGGATNAGTIEDFETVACPPPLAARPFPQPWTPGQGPWYPPGR